MGSPGYRFARLSDDAPWIHREGVLRHEPSQTDLLFVTLNKSEALFSPSTRTRDLALARPCPLGVPRGGEADGVSVAAAPADTGGVDAGDGVGGLRALNPRWP